MNSCSESKHVETKFNIILNAIACANICQLLWALDVLILERKGNRNIYPDKNTHSTGEISY